MHPINLHNAPASFVHFAELCKAVAATTRKLEKRALIADWLRLLTLGDAGRGALYLAGTPFSETDPRRLNLGGALLSKVIAEISGADGPAMHAAYLRHGDLGAAALDLLQTGAASTSTLTLQDVEDAFEQIASSFKPGPKLRLAVALLSRATPLEAKYLIKLVLGDMRTGVKQSLVEEAVAAAYGVDATQVRRASMLNGSLPEVVRMAAEGTLSGAKMKLFHALGFMLASPVDSVGEALARFAQEIAAEAKGLSEALPPEERADNGATEGPADIPVSDPVNASSDASAARKVAADSELPALSAEVAIHEAQMEDKYDGIRAQLHAGDPSQRGRVALFSRSREDMTASFPEIAGAFSRLDRPVILDGEILAWDPINRRALPFSSLQQRVGRKRITDEMKKQTPVIFMAFDVMYLGGELLLERPLSERRLALEAFVAVESARIVDSPNEGRGIDPVSSQRRAKSEGSEQQALFEPELLTDKPSAANEGGEAADGSNALSRLALAPAVQLHSAEQLEQAYSDARARGNEGVMLKARHSIYQPGRRGLAWLKLKRELATLDVVVTAVEFGHGRRAKVLSDYTFAVRDGAELKNVGKAYSGLTDAEINEYTAFFLDHTLEDYGRVRSVEPLLVLEVAFNNLMRSDRHASGFALRFPRILRIRTDKLPSDIDTIERVEEIYNSQPDRPVE